MIMKEKSLQTPKMFSRTLPVLLSGSWIMFQFIVTIDSVFALFELFLGLVIIFFIIASLITYVQDIRKYLATKSLLSFLPTITSVIFTIAFITANYVFAARDFSPVIIKASNDEHKGTSTISFREDGTYKFTISFLGDQDFRGTYQLNDSLITLDKNVDSNILSRRLIIKDMILVDSSRSYKDIGIYQINDKQQIINKDFAFRIEEYDGKAVYKLYNYSR